MITRFHKIISKEEFKVLINSSSDQVIIVYYFNSKDEESKETEKLEWLMNRPELADSDQICKLTSIDIS
jgi:hypothetical protein